MSIRLSKKELQKEKQKDILFVRNSEINRPSYKKEEYAEEKEDFPTPVIPW